MSDLVGRWIPGLDPLTGVLSLPLWAAGALIALFVVFCAIALSRAGREGLAGGVARMALVMIGAVLTWSLLDGAARPDAAAERRSLESRAGVLATRATMPGSPLACLDAIAGDTVEGSCERVLFATPEAMASAVTYVAAQLSLYLDVSRFVARGNPDLAPLLAGLRRSIESDRFGLVAQVLATRDGCTAAQCPVLAQMRDPSRISNNLAQRTYDFYVTRHASVWPAPASGTVGAPPPGPVASAPPGLPGTGLPAGASAFASPLRPPGPNVFFPSSDSIPPVSIMTSEPAVESEATGTAPRVPPRRPPQAPKQAPMDLNSARGAPPAPQ